MIPKIIHYCWLSTDPIPKEIQDCITSWKERLPDFTIKKWDSSTFDFSSIQYVAEAYENRKWAFASDYIRLYALYTDGGVYLDSDVFVIKRFDEYLENRFFSAIEAYPGINEDMQIQAAIMGSEKGHPFVADCMRYYEENTFIKADGSFDEVISPVLYAKEAEKYGFQYKNEKQVLDEGIMLYPIEEVAPITDLVGDKTKLVHCCAGSWRWEKKSAWGNITHNIKDVIVRVMITFGLKKTWNWKKKFKTFKSSQKKLK